MSTEQLKAQAASIGKHIGYWAVFGIIGFGAQLHRFFPFLGPAIGITLLMIALQWLGKRYGKVNEPRLEELEGDGLLRAQIGIARVIRRFFIAFALLSWGSFIFI